jgi:hypothetical protein
MSSDRDRFEGSRLTVCSSWGYRQEVSEPVVAADREARPVAVEPVDAPWKPRRGAPAARPGETRSQYSRRLKCERNRRHHARKRREAEARTTSQLAHTPGGAIALSIRARKPGENPLAGVTAQRLVKLNIAG